MSVRRLAEASVQPASFAFSKANAAAARKWIAKYPKGRQQSAIIPLLMLAQEQEGWVTQKAIEAVCDMLEMPYIRGLEVATFYTQYQLKPVGTRAHIQVCGTTPCMLRGAGELMDVCRSKIHHEQFHTNSAGTLSWEEVECLGACVNAPMVMVFKDTYEDLTPERLAEIIDAFESGKGATVKPGPQVDRFYSAPEGGFTALKDEKAVLKSTRDKATKTAKAAKVPPSESARPATAAAETSPALKPPAKKAPKAPPAAEATPPPPKVDAKKADQAEPAVEGVKGKWRTRPIPPQGVASAYKAPEMLKGAPVGAGGKKVASKASVKVVKPSLDHKDRPKGITRPAVVDDLKLISGVGPKNEKVLHDLGVFTFAQVASWKKAERDWVDGYLNFHGRIEREDWVKQAKALAKGGVAEYIRVFGKKPV